MLIYCPACNGPGRVESDVFGFERIVCDAYKPMGVGPCERDPNLGNPPDHGFDPAHDDSAPRISEQRAWEHVMGPRPERPRRRRAA
jgi:hypothetical protein